MASATDNNIEVTSDCQTHRLCTCDLYTTGHKYSTDRSSSPNGDKCSSNRNKTTRRGETWNGQDNDNPTVRRGELRCYSYAASTASNCNQHNNSCYPYGTNGESEQPAVCSGHRQADANMNIVFENYASGDVIENEQINIIQSYIRKEIQQRKLHAMYSGQSSIAYSDNDVKGWESGNPDLVAASQPNNIDTALRNIRSRIATFKDYKRAPSNSYDRVQVGKLVCASSLKDLESDLNDRWIDCVCYSDCTGYGAWIYYICTCNTNCRCNY